MQEHRATRLHWDFRLEAGGAMPSWAVTKGPTLVPIEKRLAMKTEDHPLDYQTFEGVIPAGNYGAGEVIVWDNGTYELAEGDDPVREIAKGKLKIVLYGKKLKGLFTLVKIKPRAGEHGEPWLMFKDHDEFEDPDWKVEEHAESVKTGRTLAELQAARKDAPIWHSNRAASADGTLVKRAAARAVKADKIPRDVKPMLTTLVDEPFDDERWLFELKWDGYRAIAVVEKDGVTLTSRTGKDLLHQFREMSSLAAAFRSIPVVVDGELCVLDAKGRPDFQALQSRDKPELKGRKRTKPSPVTYVVFDLLYADGRDLRERPLEDRKRLLEQLIVPERGVLYSKHVVARGNDLFELARAARPRRDRRQGAHGAVPLDPLARMGEDQGQTAARVRDRRLDRAAREPQRVRFAAGRRLRRRQARLRGSRRDGVRREAAARADGGAQAARAQNLAVRATRRSRTRRRIG